MSNLIDPKTRRSKSIRVSPNDYWKGWPDQCCYNDDISWAASMGINYLKKMGPILKQKGKTGLLVLDLDDTLFINDFDNVVGIEDMMLGEKDGNQLFISPINMPIRQLAKFAKSIGIKVVLLTARPPESKFASLLNLNMFDIPFDKLIMNNNVEQNCFKVRVRRSLNTSNEIVILTIGDQPFDYLLPGLAGAIKLPDKDCRCCYAYFP